MKSIGTDRSRLATPLLMGAVLSGCGLSQNDSHLLENEMSSQRYYRITFDFTWSEETHGSDGYPQRQPGQGIVWEPHFTNFSVVTHDEGYQLYELNKVASANLEGTAEAAQSNYYQQEWPANRNFIGTNAYVGCLQEQRLANFSEYTQRCLFDQGIRSPAPVTTSFVIKVLEDFPLISMASMLAPSPDWFIGTSGLSMRQGDSWIDQKSIPLYTLDAGTETGHFTYQNPPEIPRKPITTIDDSPFFGIPVGSIEFQLLNASSPGEIDLLPNEPLFDGYTEGAVPTPDRLGT